MLAIKFQSRAVALLHQGYHSRHTLHQRIPDLGKFHSMTDAMRTATYGEQTYEIVQEGSAGILKHLNDCPTSERSSKDQVFYNPIQQFNRDLSVLAIRGINHAFPTLEFAYLHR